MSTVYEESEPSTITIPNAVSLSLDQHGITYFQYSFNLLFYLFRF